MANGSSLKANSEPRHQRASQLGQMATPQSSSSKPGALRTRKLRPAR